MTSGIVPSPWLSDADSARRPTGPVLALCVVVLCLLIGQTVGLLLFGLLFGVAPDLLLDTGLGLPEQLVFTFSFLGVLAMLLAWLLLKERRPVSSLGFRGAPWRGLSLGAATGLVLVSIPILLNVLIGQYEQQGPVFDARFTGAVLLALLGFAIQGSTEEILVRGYLMQSVYRKWGLIAAIIVQALVFTALHGVNTGFGPIAVLNLVLVAVLFGFWALAEGGLWGVCALHAVWNWCQGNVYGISVSGLDVRTTWSHLQPSEGSATLLTGGGFGVEGSVVTSGVLAVAAVLAGVVFARRVRGAGQRPT